MITRVLEGEGVAVVIPCLDEEATIGKVVSDFKRVLPRARVLVIDNRSKDQTAARAAEAGAEVAEEKRKGKGFALLQGIALTRDAEYIVMVDGDDTYPAEDAPKLLEAALGGFDMVIGVRLQDHAAKAFRPGHAFGNWLFNTVVRVLFGTKSHDLFSGYRVISKRYLDESPLIAQGFEVETELSIQALARNFEVGAVPVHYRERQKGSSSKLQTYRDGYRISIALLGYFRDYRPLTCFGVIAAVLLAFALSGGWIVVDEFIRTKWVGRLPLAVLSAATFLLSAISFMTGLLLSASNRRFDALAAVVRRHSGRGVS